MRRGLTLGILLCCAYVYCGISGFAGLGAQADGASETQKAPAQIARSIGYLLKRLYYDQDRFRPAVMINRAIRAMESSEMSLEVSWDGAEIRCNFDGEIVTIPAPTPKNISEAMALIMRLQNIVEKREEYEEGQMADITYAMLNGALQTLDPHTVLFPPKPASDFQENLAGEFFGIGAYLNHEDGVVLIDRVMPGRPADKAGLHGGDKIMLVNGEKTDGLSLSETVQRIKGPRGTKVVLGVERKGEEDLLSIEVTRDLVRVQILQSYRDGEVGYVRLDEFNKNSDTVLRNILQAWDRDMENPVMGLVLDMRFNGGGLLGKARIISDMFLGKGKEIVRTVNKDGKPMKLMSNKDDISILDVPMMVLISPSSASAAEIVSGALQENHRALIVGRTSYGKGSVQQFRKLSNGSVFKYTVQEYQLKDGVSIQGVGIIPDLLLQRHSLSEDGEVDLHPYSRSSEADSEFALAAQDTYKHAIQYQLPWLAEYEDDATRRTHYISAKNFKPDQEASLAIELLAEALKSEQLEHILEDVTLDTFAAATAKLLKEPIAMRAEQEAKDLASALTKSGKVKEWGSADAVDPTALRIHYTGPREIEAGQSYDMSFDIENTGDVDYGRLFAVVRRERKDAASPFWEDEVLFGNAPALGKVSGSFSFTVPPRMYSNAERFAVDVYQDGVAELILSKEIDLRIIGHQRPRFDFSWKLKGDQVPIDFDTPYEVELIVRNNGAVASAPVTVLVSKNDNRFIQLSDGRWKLEALQPGEQHVVVVPFQINKEVKLLTRTVTNKNRDFQLEVFAEERFEKPGISQYRESVSHSLKMSVGTAVTGESFRKPQLELVKMSTDDTHIQIEVRVTDDNIDFLTVFHGRDKIALYTAEMLQDGIFSTQIGARKGLNHIQVVVRDDDGLLRYLPIRHWSATGIEINPRPTIVASDVDNNGDDIP